MRTRHWLLLAALGLASAAHAADDWLAGEYEVDVPDHPAATRFVLVITRDVQGRYDEAVYKETGDAASGRSLVRIEPWHADEAWHGGKLGEVRELSAEEFSGDGSSDLVRARARCALVGGMGICRIPEGATVDFDGRTLGPGYFAFAMHVGLIDIRRRPPGAEPRVPSTVPPGRP